MIRFLGIFCFGILLFPGLSQGTDLGVYRGAGCTGADRLPAFSAWLGRRPDRVIDFMANANWPDVINSSQWAMSCWQKEKLPVTFSVPMLPKDGYSNLEDGAKGEYDHWFRQLAQNLVSHGFGHSILRVGWEFNGGWYPWAAKNPEAWKAYYRRIVMAMRSVPKAAFRFDWCPASGWQPTPPDSVYPGDDVVDIIGMDVYNASWDPQAVTPQKRWHNTLDGPFGLSWLANFASAHKKPLSLPEWGTGTRPDGHGGGDDSLFIANMAQWIAMHHPVYQDYWDYHAPDYDAALSDGKQPHAEKAFLSAFGVQK